MSRSLRPVILSLIVISFGISTWAQKEAQSGLPNEPSYQLDPLSIVSTEYPASAREQKIEGQVQGMMLVSESGDVENVRLWEANPALAQAATDALKKCKFKPVTKNGVQIAVVAQVTFHFVLSNNQNSVKPEISAATELPNRVRVTAKVLDGLLVSKVAPIRPAKNAKGQVAVSIVITREGNVTDVQLIAGDPALAESAIDAVKQWNFKPYFLLPGRPVEVQATVQFNF